MRIRTRTRRREQMEMPLSHTLTTKKAFKNHLTKYTNTSGLYNKSLVCSFRVWGRGESGRFMYSSSSCCLEYASSSACSVLFWSELLSSWLFFTHMYVVLQTKRNKIPHCENTLFLVSLSFLAHAKHMQVFVAPFVFVVVSFASVIVVVRCCVKKDLCCKCMPQRLCK